MLPVNPSRPSQHSQKGLREATGRVLPGGRRVLHTHPVSWFPSEPATALPFSCPLAMPRLLWRKAEPLAHLSWLANVSSHKQILPCGIVAAMGKNFICFQFCNADRLLKGLSAFSSHINLPSATAPNSFCS